MSNKKPSKEENEEEKYTIKCIFNENSNVDINEVIKSSFLNAIRQNKY